MKKILFISIVIFTACGQAKTSQRSTDGAAINNHAKINATELDFSTDYVTGRFNPKSHPDFVPVAEKYADPNIYLHKKTYEAFKKMYKAARKDGITLRIISGTRNFNAQKAIWEGKWQRFEAPTDLKLALKILNYSSMPMTSRHHWGTDIDLNNLNNSYFESGEGLKIYEWLKAHANEFGFYQPYTDKSLNGRTGYNMEKWHWSYIPLASKFRAYYNARITNKDISGFKGSELAVEIDMLGKYVNGISKKIKEYGK